MIICAVPEEVTLLTNIFKKSAEYEGIQTTLKPMLDKATNEPRGKTPKYNSSFLWQVH